MERIEQTTDLTELVSRAKSGQTDAVDRLVDAYAPRLYGLLYRMVGSAAQAEDLLQETFVKMLRGLGRYREDGRFEPWLFSIAANLARDAIRRRGRAVPVATGQDGQDCIARLAGEGPGPDSRLLQVEQAQTLEQALATLSETQREVILLRFFSDLPFKQIAEMLQIPLGTALARAHRGLKHLRERLGDAPD